MRRRVTKEILYFTLRFAVYHIVKKISKIIIELSTELPIFIIPKKDNVKFMTSLGMTNAFYKMVPRRYFNKNIYAHILPSS